MAKLTKFYGLRFDPGLRERLDRVVEGPKSDFIRKAVEEKILKIEKAAKLSEGSGGLFGKTS